MILLVRVKPDNVNDHWGRTGRLASKKRVDRRLEFIVLLSRGCSIAVFLSKPNVSQHGQY
jgi:hypothetical protein